MLRRYLMKDVEEEVEERDGGDAESDSAESDSAEEYCGLEIIQVEFVELLLDYKL
jgi:hypothetical protein